MTEVVNLECRLTVSNHTVVQQYASSACSLCEVKVKAEAAYRGTFVTALTQDLWE